MDEKIKEKIEEYLKEDKKQYIKDYVVEYNIFELIERLSDKKIINYRPEFEEEIYQYTGVIEVAASIKLNEEEISMTLAYSPCFRGIDKCSDIINMNEAIESIIEQHNICAKIQNKLKQ